MSAHNHKVEQLKLANGAEGLLIHVPSATVMGILFNFRAGYFLTKDNKWETPHIMEHMAFGANTHYARARDFQAEFGKNGAYWNATTDDYHVNYETECADFEWERVLELLTLSFSQPVFLEEEFRAEFANVADELIGRSNNRGAELSLEISKALGFRSHQYSERRALMDNVTLEDIVAFHTSTHTTSNLRFVIAGNITKSRRKKITSILEQIKLPKGAGRLELPDEPTVTAKHPVILQKGDVPNVYFEAVAYVPGKFSDNDWTAAGMITNILTGTLYSKIFGEARERGLVYGMGSSFLHTKTDIGWWMSGQAQEQNLEEIAKIALREIGKLRRGELAVTDIDAARQHALGSYQRSAQTVFGVAKGYAGQYFFENIIEDYYGAPKRIETVTKRQILDIATQVYAPAHWGIGLLGAADEGLANKFRTTLEPLWQK